MSRPVVLIALAPLLLAPSALAKPAAPLPLPGLPLEYPADLQARLNDARRYAGFLDNCALHKVPLATRRRYTDLADRLDNAIGRDRGIWGMQVKGHDLDARGVEAFWRDTTQKAFPTCTVATLNQSATRAVSAIAAYEAASAARTAPMAQGLWIGPVRACKAGVVARQSGRAAPGTMALTIAFDPRGAKALRQVSQNSLNLPLDIRLDGRIVMQPILGDPLESGRIQVPFASEGQLARASAAIAEPC
ncbi:hypothetical protein [Novosphingobium sp. TH158]|uniref:hypothetical protein n=1 Tax=Novosphingobium sp. TH158 TaxID=2067455 RepID=UPI000C7B5198|nr:hypothetical protein [Novosphingobium sp. TH158]PLK27548.1 hypothetical protein C0V78_12110 [Novosphingobium sp. TH158]